MWTNFRTPFESSHIGKTNFCIYESQTEWSNNKAVKIDTAAENVSNPTWHEMCAYDFGMQNLLFGPLLSS